MRKFTTASFGSLLLLSAASAAAGDASTAIHCGHLLDTQAGKLLGETTVFIRDKRIESVVSGRQASAGSLEIDVGIEDEGRRRLHMAVDHGLAGGRQPRQF